MLKIDEIDIFYGQLQMIFGLSLSIEEGQVVSLIGANGAGKTTTLRTISGILIPRKGHIEFLNQRINGMDPHLIASMGIAHVPEGREIFPSLGVGENLDLGAITKEAKNERVETFERVYSLFPVLKERGSQLAGTLSGGEQQMLAIGRGLMAQPKLLILDEPSLGLAPFLVKEIFRIVKEINSEGTTIFLVEQNVYQSLAASNKAYVLETGHIVLQGKGEELLNNDHVKSAYLGI